MWFGSAETAAHASSPARAGCKALAAAPGGEEFHMQLPELRGAMLRACPASLCGWLLSLANLGRGKPGMGRSPSSVVGMAMTGQGLAPHAVPNLLLAWPCGSKGPV